jgi:Domain of unknown function (DUF4189)
MIMRLKDRLAMSRRVKVASGVALAGFALLGSGLAASTASAASPVQAPAAPTIKQSTMVQERAADQLRCRRPYCYGAIALAYGDTVAGLSNKASSKRAAFRNAVAECRRLSNYPCHRIGWVRNGCAAIAVKKDGRRVDKYGFAVARYANPAVRKAKRHCKWNERPVGRPCLKTAYICTKRNYS